MVRAEVTETPEILDLNEFEIPSVAFTNVDHSRSSKRFSALFGAPKDSAEDLVSALSRAENLMESIEYALFFVTIGSGKSSSAPKAVENA